MKNAIGGGDGRRGGAGVEPVPATGGVFYRVVEDDFTDSGDTHRTIDVLIQTTDPEDFADFGEAVEEAMDRIQERIDLEESSGDPDPAHLALLEEKLGDTGEALGGDWGAYCDAISQPTVLIQDEEINLAEVEGRDRFARLVASGDSCAADRIETYERLSRQAACGAGGPRIRAKALKSRPRTPLDLAKVKIDPILAAAYDPSLIRGLLGRYK